MLIFCEYERRCFREKALKLEELNSNNPMEFWQHIRKMSNPNLVGNSFCIDEEVVLNKWLDHLYNLLNVSEN